MASLSFEPKTPVTPSSVTPSSVTPSSVIQSSGVQSPETWAQGTETLAAVCEVLGQSLLLAPDVTAGLSADTLLFGNLPELDSMAVATVLTALEDRFGILIDDDEVSGELFETVGSLAVFIKGKLDAAGAR